MFPQWLSRANLQLGPFGRQPIPFDRLEMDVPSERQYVLRMMIKQPNNIAVVPSELLWTHPLIDLLNCPKDWFMYLTIRNGLCTSTTDDEWHVDGFSMKIPHPAEFSLIWSDKLPTEFFDQMFKFIPEKLGVIP